MITIDEECLQKGCEGRVTSVHSRCGGNLFGTKDQMKFSCGGLFCNEHLWAKNGPFRCRPCYDTYKLRLQPDGRRRVPVIGSTVSVTLSGRVVAIDSATPGGPRVQLVLTDRVAPGHPMQCVRMWVHVDKVRTE